MDSKINGRQTIPQADSQFDYKTEHYATVASFVIVAAVASGTLLWSLLTDTPFDDWQLSIVTTFVFLFLSLSTVFCVLVQNRRCTALTGFAIQATVLLFFALLYVGSTIKMGLPSRPANYDQVDASFDTSGFLPHCLEVLDSTAPSGVEYRLKHMFFAIGNYTTPSIVSTVYRYDSLVDGVVQGVAICHLTGEGTNLTVVKDLHDEPKSVFHCKPVSNSETLLRKRVSRISKIAEWIRPAPNLFAKTYWYICWFVSQSNDSPGNFDKGTKFCVDNGPIYVCDPISDNCHSHVK